MADWVAEITPDGQKRTELTFFAPNADDARAFVERHMLFYGGEIHQIRQVDYTKIADPFEEKQARAARKTLGGY